MKTEAGSSMENETKLVTKRLQSLDALRGFDMFWIIGGGALVQILARCFPGRLLQSVSIQMEHVPWAGFHFEDLIFPLFMFISGVTIPITILSKLENGTTKRELIIKNTKRMITLILLGIIFNGVLRNGFTNARYASVLGQIGISYFIASLIVIYSRSMKSQLFWLIEILVLYAAVQLFIPVPGFGAGVLTPEGCINGYIDRLFLPGRLAYGHDGMVAEGVNGIYDALGILSVISASGITLMGYFAGRILLQKKSSSGNKLAILTAIGSGLIILALLIHPSYPVIKNCWTTTFNLLTGGISFLLVALFYQIIDVWGFNKWSFVFQVIGMNSIFIYLIVAGHLVNISSVSMSLFGWIARPLSENGGQVVIVLGNIILSWSLLYFMYIKKIFVKV